MNTVEEIMALKNSNLSKYACLDEDAIYLDNIDKDMRTSFFRDIDKIIYTLGFVRYVDKTQVFTYKNNDHIQKRVIHVIYVSKIARHIGRALNLNEDLIEAAALGHDLGHTPFGHVGEAILNKISLEHNEGYFNHNIESVRLLTKIENYGKGLNITLQTLDAIMCHNGELVMGKYEPMKKTIEEFWREYEATYHDKNAVKNLIPMTLEGCVVRISDLIAYLGRDIEDGIRMGLIKESEIPKSITSVLGTKNKDIINTIVLDVIKNSYNKNYIKLSDNIYKAIVDLKDFNYEHIYKYAYSKEEHEHLEVMLRSLFDKYSEDLDNLNPDSSIVKYYNYMSDAYKNNTKNRIIIDYIAGMTDDFCIKEYNKITNNTHTK